MVGYRSNTPSEYMRKHMNMDISANMTGHLKMTVEAVSYTHLTLPTKRIV